MSRVSRRTLAKAFISMSALAAAGVLSTFLHPRTERPVFTACARGCCFAKTWPPARPPHFTH